MILYVIYYKTISSHICGPIHHIHIPSHVACREPGDVHQGDEETDPAAQIGGWRCQQCKREGPGQPDQVVQPQGLLELEIHWRSELW